MLTRLERRVVGRYLRPTKGEGFIFLVASISLIAVALGVAALIAVMSVMNGFRAELFDRILGLNGHAIVQGYGGRIEGWRELLASARATPGVTSATPLIEQPLMASHRDRVEGVLVRGMTLSDIARMPVLAEGVVSGDLARLAEPRTVALGAELARTLGVETGGEITLISPQGQATPFGTAPRIVSYRVVALFRVGIFDFDKAFVLMRLDEAQTLFDLGDAVGVIEVKTVDPDRAPALLMPLAAAAEGQAAVIPWQSMNAQLFEALAVERVAMFWILSIIILVAAFNIVSALIMLVRAKTRDIAILRTMGASRAAVLRVFVGVGLILGVAGTLLGLALGFLVLWQRQAIVVALQRLTGANLWDPSIRFLSELPARVDPGEVVAITLMALVLSLLATLYPAWKAAATDPVAVLRHG
jgi:lipoprotein-releasing system permease protein